MQKTFLICERVNHFHSVTLDEELDIEDIVSKATDNVKLYDAGYEAISDILNKYKEKYGFDYEVKSNDCGTEVLGMDVIEEM